MPAALGQTITIVNQSGKIVKTSKHLVNVFKEAKSAYDEKKAEIRAVRQEKQSLKDEERRARIQFEALDLNDNDDVVSKASSRRGSKREGHSERRSTKATSRPAPVERSVSDSFYTNDRQTRATTHRHSPLRHDSTPSEPRVGELTRRHTEGMQLRSCTKASLSRRASLDDIDMDLAYGELPPPLPSADSIVSNELELRSKMSSLQTLLDELHCVQHSALATIDNLQKNPEALAAVALTLAEISNLATKLAPGALLSMKGAFPGIIALLCSPQFAIAAGVGVGVTIIAFGGYKIVKKIRAQKELERGMVEEGNGHLLGGGQPAFAEREEENMDELRELSRVEQWRRGVADMEVGSLGTSVDGEFVTPQAERTLIEEGRLTEADFKSTVSGSETGSRRHHRKKKVGEKSEISSASKRGSESKVGSGGSSASGRRSSKVMEKKKKKMREPSGLRMLFQSHA